MLEESVGAANAGMLAARRTMTETGTERRILELM